MTIDERCPCGCSARTAVDDLAGHEDHCAIECEPGLIAVRVSNSYECGRRSGWVQRIAPPPPLVGGSLHNWLVEQVVTGDGHPCGAREHAHYQVEIVAAADRPDLVGVTGVWEG